MPYFFQRRYSWRVEVDTVTMKEGGHRPVVQLHVHTTDPDDQHAILPMPVYTYSSDTTQFLIFSPGVRIHQSTNKPPSDSRSGEACIGVRIFFPVRIAPSSSLQSKNLLNNRLLLPEVSSSSRIAMIFPRAWSSFPNASPMRNGLPMNWPDELGCWRSGGVGDARLIVLVQTR